MEEITRKDFLNLVNQFDKIENQINALKTLPKSIQNLTERIETIENNLNPLKKLPKSFQNLTERIETIENNLNPMKTLPKDVQELKEKTNKLESDVINNSKETYYNREQMEEKIRIQEEIIMDMLKKFNDEYYKHKSKVSEDIETIKTQQDVLKISYAVNENKLIAKIKSLISTELKNRIQGQENEILMKIWIDEFKEIANNFEKLKKVKPKEFNLRLNEILNTIEQFKEKIHTFE
ncbi:MAG: hypothetical protein ACFFC1_03260 [Promethearchaeota archaeon]